VGTNGCWSHEVQPGGSIAKGPEALLAAAPQHSYCSGCSNSRIFFAPESENPRAPEKLVVDFVGALPMCADRKVKSMEQDTRKLVVRLCSHAGAMMEDASVPAVTAGRVGENELASVIEHLNKQTSKIFALLAAAAALMELVSS
jgi:hypothetical protein